jgi:hypothetical protein
MDAEVKGGTEIKCPGCVECTASETQDGSRRQSDTSGEATVSEIEMTTASMRRHTTNQTHTNQTTDEGGRRKVARFLNWASAALATHAHKQIEKGGFKRDSSSYPETPGEGYKNPHLQKQIERYRGSSIAPSFRSSRGSFDNGEGPSNPPNRARSQTRRHESLPVSSPPRASSRPGRDHSGSLPGGGLLDSSPLYCPPSPRSPSREWTPQLSLSSGGMLSRSRANSDVSPTTTSPGLQSLPTPPPKIVISSDGGG